MDNFQEIPFKFFNKWFTNDLISTKFIDRANEKLDKDLCLFEILGTINKLKAAMSVVLDDDEKLIEKIKLEYFMNSTVFMNNESDDFFEK